MFENQLIQALLTGKPYFGPVMRAMQGPPVRHGYLGALVESLTKSKPRGNIYVLEIGSWAGASAITWAGAMKAVGRKGRITCVDLWQPYFDLTIEHEFHYKEMTEAAKENKIFNLFLHNIRAANVSDMVDYVVGNARDVLPKFPADKFDIVYIDGSHVYEDVCSDIRNAKRLVRDGGIICGDDLELQRRNVRDAEHNALVATGKDFVYLPGAEAYYHPGVTEAVAVEFGEVSSWEGVWAMRKYGSKWTKVELNAGTLEIPDHIKAAASALEFTQTADVAFVGSTQDFNLVKAKGQFLAVAKQLGPTELFIERLGERELVPVLFIRESLEEVQERALKHEEKSNVMIELVGETEDFNLVKSKGRFLAVAKSLGPSNLFVERLGERELPPFVFTGESFEEVRKKAQRFESQTVEPEVELVDEVGSYNLVKAGERFIAVAKALGPLDLFRERVGERDLPPLVLVDRDCTALRQRIYEIEHKPSKD